MIEITGRQHQFVPGDWLSAQSRFHEITFHQFRIRPNAQAFDPRDAAIVFQRFFARRLGASADQRVIPDLEPLGRREKGHVDRVADDRVRERARVDHERIDAAAFGGNGARQTDRPGADDDSGFVLHGGNLSRGKISSGD